MSSTDFISNRLQEVFLDGKWIANTNYKELLSTVSFNDAIYQIENLNTIAALTQHINYYVAGVLQVLKGGNLTIKDKYSFDFPPVESKKEWQDIVEQLCHNATQFITTVRNMENKQLTANFVKEEYGSYQRNLEAMIEHSYYHLGQLSLINILIKNKKRAT